MMTKRQYISLSILQGLVFRGNIPSGEAKTNESYCRLALSLADAFLKVTEGERTGQEPTAEDKMAKSLEVISNQLSAISHSLEFLEETTNPIPAMVPPIEPGEPETIDVAA